MYKEYTMTKVTKSTRSTITRAIKNAKNVRVTEGAIFVGEGADRVQITYHKSRLGSVPRITIRGPGLTVRVNDHNGTFSFWMNTAIQAKFNKM